jgi:hypothetical protein
VTRLGKFSSVGWLFTLGTLFENYRSRPYFGGYFFHGKGFCISFVKKRVGLHFGWFFSHTHLVTLGSMLWSQFLKIFENFRRKNWRFSQKPMLWPTFCII